MADVYELMFLPRLHASSHVLVTSRGASVDVRIYTDGVSSSAQKAKPPCARCT